MNQDQLSEIPVLVRQFPDFHLLEQELLASKHWEDRYRSLLKMAGLMPIVPKEWKREEFLVKGCQSKAWLWSYCDQSRFWFVGESDSKIVKSLLFLVLARWNGLVSSELDRLDVLPWLQELGLERHLSSSRMGGLGALVQSMKNASS